MKSERIFNFSAGPAVLPVPVLEQAQRELVSLPDVGMSILEVSHRSKVFEGVLARAEADIRQLANVPSNYRVLFLQGGASLQFTMVPMNLLSEGMTADYLVTGAWSSKAVDEAKKIGKVHVAATTKAEQFTRIPARRRDRADAGRGVRAHDVEQHDLRNGVEGASGRRRHSARQRYVVRHVQPSDRRRAARAHLRGSAEEHGTGGRDGRHHPRGSARAVSGVAARDAELRGARRERVDVQHAAGVRDLHARAGHAVADWPGRSRARLRR